eukprot:TRINITY_DN28045_c0_g1_i3.p1 TRINITY_DN28045_c0_g1~~TRINITY_DN28045_c0_g1_i3.p1  ORF type:complete len:626 (-),score=142.68 TRINITY_DN28045_c0_g1_i3:289-2166(-)
MATSGFESDCGVFSAAWLQATFDLAEGAADNDSVSNRHGDEDCADEAAWTPPKEDVAMTAEAVRDWAEHNAAADVGGEGGASERSPNALLLLGAGFATLVPNVLESQGGSDLRLLCLDLNRIVDLSGLPALPALRCLSLRGNRLASAAGLARSGAMDALEAIDLSQNVLEDLAGLETLTALRVIKLASNRLGPGLECLKPVSQAPLVTVDVSDNYLSETSGVAETLASLLPRVEVLDLSGNDVSLAMRQYRRRLIASLPFLAHLDRRPVPQLERLASEAWVAGGAAAETKVRQDFVDAQQGPVQQALVTWALPGSDCSVCGCRHPPSRPRKALIKPVSDHDASSAPILVGEGGKVYGQGGDKIKRMDLKSAGFEPGDDALTVGWRSMPDFLRNMPVAKPKPRPKPKVHPAIAAAERRCAELGAEGRALSRELLARRREADGYDRRQRELQRAAEDLDGQYKAVEDGLRGSSATGQLQALSKAQVGEIKQASRSSTTPAEMRTLLEAIYHMLSVQPGQRFRRLEQKEWSRVQRAVQADDFVERLLAYDPAQLLGAPALMQHLATLTGRAMGKSASGASVAASAKPSAKPGAAKAATRSGPAAKRGSTALAGSMIAGAALISSTAAR